MRKEAGITLIALIISIIILIILVAITIGTLSNFDIINIAGKAAENYKSEEEREIAMFNELTQKYGNGYNGEESGIAGSTIENEEIKQLKKRISDLEDQNKITEKVVLLEQTFYNTVGLQRFTVTEDIYNYKKIAIEVLVGGYSYGNTLCMTPDELKIFVNPHLSATVDIQNKIGADIQFVDENHISVRVLSSDNYVKGNVVNSIRVYGLK